MQDREFNLFAAAIGDRRCRIMIWLQYYSLHPAKTAVLRFETCPVKIVACAAFTLSPQWGPPPSNPSLHFPHPRSHSSRILLLRSSLAQSDARGGGGSRARTTPTAVAPKPGAAPPAAVPVPRAVPARGRRSAAGGSSRAWSSAAASRAQSSAGSSSHDCSSAGGSASRGEIPHGKHDGALLGHAGGSGLLGPDLLFYDGSGQGRLGPGTASGDTGATAVSGETGGGGGGGSARGDGRGGPENVEN
ncbi:hypothetical protein U9M48_015372 [Paspalum notatum var. saurae]|uniref:Uncharacterized protein n=1 Tax=Paspalum notatum var. saurae TaxID=547442 RepID=A0AAQ3T305_PASNO